MIKTLVLFGHLMVACLIIALVLLQRGKGAEAGTGFGAGASGTVFGARGSASFFSRATAVLATLFYATSLALAYFATQTTGPESVFDESTTEAGTQIIEAAPEASPAEDSDTGSVPPVPTSNLPPGVSAVEETPGASPVEETPDGSPVDETPGASPAEDGSE